MDILIRTNSARNQENLDIIRDFVGTHHQRHVNQVEILNPLVGIEQRNLATIAFPAISTDVYRYPPELAASVAVYTALDFLETHQTPSKFIFCCFSDSSTSLHEKTLTTALT